MKPVYGLAESSLCVTAPLPGREPRVDRVARGPFERGRRIEPATAADANPLTFVGCGRAPCRPRNPHRVPRQAMFLANARRARYTSAARP